VPRNDPTDTGGLFVGRRPGTAPLRYRGTPAPSTGRRRVFDAGLAVAILTVETLLCLTLWGLQPLAWLWVGSQVDYETGSVEAGIVVAFLGMTATLMITLALAKQLDEVWKLVRRAAGYPQKEGMLERIFVVSLGIAGTAFLIWFFLIEGPGPSIAPRD
jgi:hypothetical protein